MDGLTLDEVAVLLFAEFVFHFVDGQFGLEGEKVVEQFHAAAREVVEEIGVGPVFFVEHVGEYEELIF